jgi:AraC-like DNA-binding protein
LRLFATPMPLAGIAVRAGYYDQAHLARTVKVMTGRTPTQLRAERARGAFTARADRLPGRITTILLSE